jgi:hypothetical protein
MTLPLALSSRDRHAIIVGVVTIGALVVIARGVPAWRAWHRGLHTRTAVASAEFAHAQERVRVQPVLADSLAARGARLIALAPAILDGESPAAAGATLAGLVSGAAAGAGVRLGAVQIRSDSLQRAMFTRITIRAEAVGDVRGVTRMLAALERGPTLLAIRALSIDQPEPAAPPEQMEVLRCTLTVEGVMLTRTPERHQ